MRGYKVKIKKWLAVSLCAVMIGGTALAVPGVLPDHAVIADAAEVWGDFEYEVNSDGAVIITKYTGYDEELTIPQTINEMTVAGINNYAFSENATLAVITLPDGMTKVDPYAFYGSSVKTINLPETVTEIGSYAFEFCTKLEKVNIAGTITTISNGAFYGCTGLTDFILKDGIEKIEHYSFLNTGLTSVVIPESITEIGHHSFGFTYEKNVYTLVEGFQITGYKDTPAETYCTENDITFIPLEKPLSNEAVVSTNTVPKDTAVTIRGAASGGKGDYKYAFYYKKSTSSAWTSLGELYGNTKEVTFVPAAVAKYLVKVNVKDSAGTMVTKQFTVNSVKHTANDLTNTSVLDKTTTEKGKPITITASATGGSGNYKFAFYYKKTTSKAFTAIGTEYGDAVSATFTPASYNVRINVKDSSGTLVVRQYKITATSSSSLNNTSTISATDVAKGTRVTLTGKASGGTAPYEYAFYYKKSASKNWTTIGTAFDSATEAFFTPGMKATYEAKVVVKDSTGKTVEKTFTINSK